MEVAAGYYRVDNYVDLDLASDYSWNSVVDLMVVDEAFDAEDSLEDFVVMDEISSEEDSSCFPLEGWLALSDDDSLDNSSSKFLYKMI